jgi:hypothetical protein
VTGNVVPPIAAVGLAFLVYFLNEQLRLRLSDWGIFLWVLCAWTGLLWAGMLG